MGKRDESRRKLVLRRQTLRRLDAKQLDRVNGGMAYTQAGSNCDTTICDPDELNVGGGWGGGWDGGWGGGWDGGWGGDWGW